MTVITYDTLMLQNLQKALQANPDAHSFDEVLLFYNFISSAVFGFLSSGWLFKRHHDDAIKLLIGSLEGLDSLCGLIVGSLILWTQSKSVRLRPLGYVMTTQTVTPKSVNLENT
jgi:hypothetical protein